MKKFTFAAWLNLHAAEATGKPRRFDILAYTGGKLAVDGFDLPVIVDLAGLDSSAVCPILIDHENTIEATLGMTDRITNDGKSVSITGPVTGQSGKSQLVIAQAAAGHQWQASIGALVGDIVEVKASQTVTVNGQTFTGPVLVSRRSVLREITVLAMGADSSTSVNLAAKAATGKGSRIMSFEEWLKELGLDPAALSAENRSTLQLAYDALQNPVEGSAKETAPAVPVAKVVDPVPATANAAADINLRAALKLQATAFAGQMRRIGEIQAKCVKHPLIAATAIEKDWSLDKVDFELLKAQMQTTVTATSFRKSEKDFDQGLVLEAAVCLHRGTRNVEKDFAPEILQTAHSEYRGRIGLHQMMIQAAIANGYSARAGEGIHQGNLGDVLFFACPDRRARHLQAASTLSLPNILSNIANKELLTGYMEEEQSWREVAGRKSVNDFKAATSIRMLDDMQYEEVGPDGRIPHGTLADEKYTRQAKTYAKMFALARTEIINDDLGAFDDLRQRIGAGSAKKVSRVFWAAWLNNAAFFTAGRGNYITGATTTLLTDLVGLQLALNAFDSMRTPTADGAKVPGGLVGGSPSILLTPGGGIASVAEQIFKNSNLGPGTATSNANIFSGRYKPVKSVFLNDATITGNSATGWYLLRDPGKAPGVVVSFLNGQETPTVETAEADFNTLGIQFRGYHDFGVDQAEYLCGVKSKGAA